MRSWNSSVTIRGVLATTGLVLAITGCDRKPAQPPHRESLAQVAVVAVKPQAVTLTTELPGRTTAFLTADLRPQVTGVVLRRTFTEGSDVNAGQQLYQIDPATYQATYDMAQATLQKDRAALVTAKAKTGRYKSLAAAQAVSRQDYDDALAASAEADATIAADRASIEQARINLAYTKVLAPISGRTGRSSVTPGALVTSGQTASLVTVTQLDPIYVDVAQPAATVLRFRRELAAGKIQQSGPNQAQVDLILDDASVYPYHGVLQFSEVNVDQSTGTVVLRAIFPNPRRLLLPGLYVRAKLNEGEDDNAIVLPQQAVSHNHRGDATVLVVGKDNKVAGRVVQTSTAIGANWVISAGLQPGERVIVDGLQKARVGAQVQVVQADPEPSSSNSPSDTGR